MRKMQDTHNNCLGLIPSDWKYPRLKYYCKISNGSDPQTEGKIPVYGSGKEIVKYCGEYKEGPAILLGRKGTLDRPRYVEGKFWNVDTAMDAYPINGINARYLYFVTTILDIGRYATVTAKPSMTQGDYYNMPIPLPPVDEQEQIVCFIESKSDSITESIARHQSIIEKLEEYKKSVITQAVTKGLNPNVETKDSGIKWASVIPKHWKIKPNKYVMRKYKEIIGEHDGQPILSLTLEGVKIRNTEDFKGKQALSYDGYQKAFRGNILMCLFDIDVTPRCVGLINDDGITSPAYTQFVLDSNDFSTYYYYYYLNLDYTKELLHLSKNIRNSLTADDFGTILTIEPPYEEQVQIAEYLDDKCIKVSEAISRQRIAIEKLEEYKKSLIYNAVTGKIDCRNT